jgi:probable H4MPT-linked C1 transfer pathway protein
MNWLALDIGGANLKLADGKSFALARSFQLFRDPQALAQELRMAITECPPSDRLVCTMTGELCDCFPTKAEGVGFILQALQDASDGRHTRVYLTTGALVTPQVARTRALQVAAANWHALARFCGRFAARGPALLVDIGSTTTDIVPLIDGQPAAKGLTDTQRMLHGELVYTGVERSPVCAIAGDIPYRGGACPLAQEFFATMRDVYVILGNLPEDPTADDTADGRPATKAAARARLGRAICADREEFNHRDAAIMAEALAAVQTERIAAAMRKVAASLGAAPEAIILSGHGEFLARRALEAAQFATPNLVSLARELGTAASRSAPAHALAVLARESSGG